MTQKNLQKRPDVDKPFAECDIAVSQDSSEDESSVWEIKPEDDVEMAPAKTLIDERQ